MNDDLLEIQSLSEAEVLVERCQRCPLYQDATQAVFGTGPKNPAMMLVGEQPGDQEDLQGKPFVGPAGQLLDQALSAAGIDRSTVYLTNAVKHFKFQQRGKRRIHQRPSAGEIDHCRWWLKLERRLVRPDLIVALGASAVRGVLERSSSIKSLRGVPQETADGTPVLVTVHPSYLLRLPDEVSRRREYDAFVGDLKMAAEQTIS